MELPGQVADRGGQSQEPDELDEVPKESGEVEQLSRLQTYHKL